jgi:elongation factor P
MNIEEVHKNSKLLINKIPYNVDNAEFMKPGKGCAIYRLRLKNLFNLSTLDITFHSGDKVEEVRITGQDMQYLYKETDHYVFMNTQTFEQLLVTEKQMGDRVRWLREGTVVNVQLMDDTIPLDIGIPTFMELAVVETGMAIKSATVTQQTKSAKLETGAVIDVPPFIKEGDVLKIDTRTGAYVERVNAKK